MYVDHVILKCPQCGSANVVLLPQREYEGKTGLPKHYECKDCFGMFTGR
jgi:transposase-like protein